jgi:hypothetical protein
VTSVSTFNVRHEYEIDEKETIFTVFVSSAAASSFAPRLPMGFSLRFNVVSVYFDVTNNECELNQWKLLFTLFICNRLAKYCAP